jgi:hypothetical protein
MSETEQEKNKKIDELVQALGKLYPSTRHLIWRSFLQGIFVGLGTTLGVSIVLAVLTYTISQLKLIPILKDIISQTNVEKVLPKSD